VAGGRQLENILAFIPQQDAILRPSTAFFNTIFSLFPFPFFIFPPKSHHHSILHNILYTPVSKCS